MFLLLVKLKMSLGDRVTAVGYINNRTRTPEGHRTQGILQEYLVWMHPPVVHWSAGGCHLPLLDELVGDCLPDDLLHRLDELLTLLAREGSAVVDEVQPALVADAR